MPPMGPPRLKKIMPYVGIALILITVVSYYFIFFQDYQFGGEADVVVTQGGNGTYALEEGLVDEYPELRELLLEASRNDSATATMEYGEATALTGELRDRAEVQGTVHATYRGERYRIALRVGGQGQ